MSLRYWSCIAALSVVAKGFTGEAQVTLAPPPEVRSQNHIASLTLHAALNISGRDAFAYEGKSIAPLIRVSPGDTLKIDYVNDLPIHPKETCAISPCMDMTNLHFHGLEISPLTPQDDVIDMMAVPGETLHYLVQIPQIILQVSSGITHIRMARVIAKLSMACLGRLLSKGWTAISPRSVPYASRCLSYVASPSNTA